MDEQHEGDKILHQDAVEDVVRDVLSDSSASGAWTDVPISTFGDWDNSGSAWLNNGDGTITTTASPGDLYLPIPGRAALGLQVRLPVKLTASDTIATFALSINDSTGNYVAYMAVDYAGDGTAVVSLGVGAVTVDSEPLTIVDQTIFHDWILEANAFGLVVSLGDDAPALAALFFGRLMGNSDTTKTLTGKDEAPLVLDINNGISDTILTVDLANARLQVPAAPTFI